jgi:hypothetical protein
MRLCSLAAGAALAMTLALPVANASTSPGGIRHTAYLSSTESDFARRAAIVASNVGSTLDYRVAASKYRTSAHPISWRRQYAYGWLRAGGAISHISSAEKTAVIKLGRAMLGLSPLSTVTPYSPYCTGSHGVSVLSYAVSYKLQVKLNSCQTNALVNMGGYCSLAAGAMGFMFPSVYGKAALGAASLLCGANTAWLYTAQQNSSVHAVRIRMPLPGDAIYRLVKIPAIYYPQ